MFIRLAVVLFSLISSSGSSAEESYLTWERFGLDQGQPKFLPPSEAFIVSASVSGAFLEFQWKIAKGYYLYKEKIRISSEELPAINDNLHLPEGDLYDDLEFGEVEIYRDSLRLIYPIPKNRNLAKKASFLITYQGCAEAGLCYAPASDNIGLDLGVDGSRKPTPITSGSVKSISIYMLVFTFMGFGLLLSMTPCVFPMIPILSGILVGGRNSIDSGRAFRLSSIYVLSMAATYSLLGVLVALLGRELQMYLHHPLSIFFMSGIFLFLGLSMLGLYNLEIPRLIKEPLDRFAKGATPNTFRGVGTMGALSALIATPCVTPPLAAVLTYVADSGSPSRGALALFSLGIGMGLPLVAFGTSVGALAPRAGKWMESIKLFLGLVLLGFAVWFAERIMTELTAKVAWAMFASVLVVYFLVGFNKWLGLMQLRRLRKTVYVCFLSLFSVCIAFALTEVVSSTRLLQLAKTPETTDINTHKSVDSLMDLNAQIALAAKSGRPVLVEFFADWCVECKRMEAKTFGDKRVGNLIQEFSILRVDLTLYTTEHRAILEHFGLFGPPAILFFLQSPKNEVFREIGFVDAKRFLDTLEFVLRRST